MLEQIIQIISIVIFLSTAIGFFIKIGEYKSIINTRLAVVEEDIKELKQGQKEFQLNLDKIENKNNSVTTKLETLLIEVKTKVELLVSYSGLVGHDERPKK